MSTLKTNTLQNVAASKSIAVSDLVDGAAKAWVNFNGTGTVAINKAFNVSSITDNGVGDYTLNFTTLITDANYSVAGVVNGTTTSGAVVLIHSAGAASAPTTKTTSALRIYTGNTSGTSDFTNISVLVFN